MVCLLAFIVLVIVVAVVYQTQWAGSLNRVYSAIVERYGGSFRKTWLPCRPTARFKYQELDVFVQMFAKGLGPARFTRVQIQWPDPDFRCSVFPDHAQRRKRFRGMQDIEVGNAAFDLRFVVTGNDDERVRQVIGPAVQEEINALYHLRRNHQIYLSFTNGRLLIVKRSVIRQPHVMLKFIAHCLAIVDAAMLADTHGIEFLSEQAAVEQDGVVCQICGETIQEGVVYCRSCKTPHHDDCWSYYGACSTYGCGQTRNTK